MNARLSSRVAYLELGLTAIISNTNTYFCHQSNRIRCFLPENRKDLEIIHPCQESNRRTCSWRFYPPVLPKVVVWHSLDRGLAEPYSGSRSPTFAYRRSCTFSAPPHAFSFHLHLFHRTWTGRELKHILEIWFTAAFRLELTYPSMLRQGTFWGRRKTLY